MEWLKSLFSISVSKINVLYTSMQMLWWQAHYVTSNRTVLVGQCTHWCLEQSRTSGSGWYTGRAVIERGHSANIATGAYWTIADSKTAWRLPVSEAEIYQNTKHEFVFEKYLVSFDNEVDCGSYELLCYYHPHHLQSCCWLKSPSHIPKYTWTPIWI